MSETIWKIYKTTCLVNGKVYIGQTIKEGYKYLRYIGSGRALLRAVNKYGKNNFIKQILIVCNTQEQADEYEELFIEMYSSCNKVCGYNILTGTANKFGSINPSRIPEIARKMSERMMGVGLGRKVSDETRRKLSISLKGKNKGKRRSDEVKKKMSIERFGIKNSFHGKKHSIETRRIISDKRTGIKLSEEHKKSISKSISGGKNHLARPVESYDPITNKAIEKFDCIAEAKRQNGNCHVDLCVLGLRKRANKKYWRYATN